MVTTLQALEEIIKQTPFLEEGLAKGIINLSALARDLKPRVEKRLYKKTTEAALVMSLKRLSPTFKKKRGNVHELKKIKNLTVRSGLMEIAFSASRMSSTVYERILESTRKQPDLFVNFSQGAVEVAVILNQSLEKMVKKVIPSNAVIGEIRDMAAITLKLDPGHIYVPGVQYALLKSLAWENINVLENISAYSELTIFVAEKDVERAFSCIKKNTSQ